MRTQVGRDEKTLVITTALGLWVCLTVAAAAAIRLADSLFDLSDGTTSSFGLVAVIGASVASFAYLAARSRR